MCIRVYRCGCACVGEGVGVCMRACRWVCVGVRVCVGGVRACVCGRGCVGVGVGVWVG